MCKYNKKTLCQPKSCGCPIPDLSAACVVYKNNDLTCTGVPGDDTLENIIKGLDTAICEKFELFTGYGALINTGAGAEIYKGNDVQGRRELRTVESSDESVSIVETENTIDITIEPQDIKPLVSNDNTVTITENPTEIDLSVDLSGFDDGIPRFIVNNLYTGADEQGTLSKPYKTVSAALAAYQGSGDKDNPEFEGGIIIIQKGNNYTLNGDITYSNLNIIVESGADVRINNGNDYDLDMSVLPTNKNITNSIVINTNGVLRMYGLGIKSNGSTIPETNRKVIEIEGSGLLVYERAYEQGTALFNINADNLPNLVSNTGGGILRVSGIESRTVHNTFYIVGKGLTVRFDGGVQRAGESGTGFTPIPFINNGGSVSFERALIIFGGNTYNTGFKLNANNTITELVIEKCIIQPQNEVSTLFYNDSDEVWQPKLEITQCLTRYGGVSNVFGTLNVWRNIEARYNYFEDGVIGANVDLTKNNTIGVSNIFGGDNVDSLPEYTDKTSATTAGLIKGTKFVNTTTDTIDIIT